MLSVCPGLSIVIIMALAFVVGVLVLAIGLVFLRRQRGPPRGGPPRPDTYQDTALMLTDHTSNEIYVKHAITCNITAEANAALMARRSNNMNNQDGNDYASMKLLGQPQPPTSSSETNSYDEDPNPNRKPPPAGGQQQGSIDWLDQDTPPPPPQYDEDAPPGQGGEGGQHLECCPELLRGHRAPPAAIRYIVPPHQCQQCGGQKPGQQVQTLGRYRTEPPNPEDTPAKQRRHISFTSTLPSSKFTP